MLTTFRSLNRYSMPVNSTRNRLRSSTSNAGNTNSLGPLNTTSFLFDENHEDKHLSMTAVDLTSPIAKAYAQLGGDDTFPTLRSDGFSGRVSSLSIISSTITDACFSFLQIQQLLTWPNLKTQIPIRGHWGLVIVQLTKACLIPIPACTARS